MPVSIPSYNLVGLDAVPVEVRVDGDEVRIIGRETGGVLLARTFGPGLSQLNLAPATIKNFA